MKTNNSFTIHGVSKYMGCIGMHWGQFTHTISVPMSVTITINVYHCVNGDGLMDRLGSEPILFVSVNLMVTEIVCVNGPLVVATYKV